MNNPCYDWRIEPWAWELEEGAPDEPEGCRCAGEEHGTECPDFEPPTAESLRGEP